MTARARLLVLVISAPVVAFAVVGGVLGKALARDEPYPHLAVFQDVVQLVLGHYVEPVNTEKLMAGAMRGLTEGLDAESAYLTPEQVKAVEAGDAPMKAAGDVGLDLSRQYYLRVVSAREGSPAYLAGLRPGDWIREIDGKPTRLMSAFEGNRLLRGAPGTSVRLTVLRGNMIDPHDVVVKRAKPDLELVTSRMLADRVGYLRIVGFGPQAAEQVRQQAGRLGSAGAQGLVIDVRNCSDGPIENGLAVARVFVRTGTLAIRVSPADRREPVAAGDGADPISGALAVLVDRGTAGPAELFASALAERLDVELIGERTHGRAATQRLIKLSDGSGLWLSTVRYLTASEKPIHEQGLVPGVEVEAPDVDFGAAPPPGDPILERALERLRARKAA